MKTATGVLLALLLTLSAVKADDEAIRSPGPVATTNGGQGPSDEDLDAAYDELDRVLREMVRQGGLYRVLCNLKPETADCARLPQS